MNKMEISRSELLKLVVSRFLMAFFVLAAIFFLPAWTLAYWQAWLYLLVLFSPMLLIMPYFFKHNPDLLMRRMRFREKETDQKLIVILSWIPFLLSFILPGFDVRLGWFHVPWGLVILGDALVLLGYAMVLLTFRENRYASRIIEVEEEQTVISSGPYALVRHPMYTGTILLYGFSPLALGSYWAMIPALFIIPVPGRQDFERRKSPGQSAQGIC
ncbi:MAG: isoprenylcysteine carboxylmethyltransferase family protein [Anaerolineaceae bacterium]